MTNSIPQTSSDDLDAILQEFERTIVKGYGYGKVREKLKALISKETTPLLDALQRVVNRSAPAGSQDGDFVGYYILPTGPIHAAIPLLQAAGRDAGRHNVPEAVEQYQVEIERLTKGQA